MSSLPSKAKRIAVKLSKAGQRSVKQGHPWIFKDAIVKSNQEAKTGDLAIIFDNHTDKVIGLGYFDIESPIRIKMLWNNGPATIDNSFFESRIEQAYSHRKPLLAKDTNGYRLIFGENDGLPGLIVDIYAKVAVLKLYSGIWLQHLYWLPEFICGLTAADTVVLRLSRRMEKRAESYTDGQVLHGELEEPDVTFKEHGLSFIANVLKGHKTGYFLDHRHNRKAVGQMASGKTVLDVFAYAGGFSVHALAGGASEVTSVDLSAQALELARKNAELNTHKGVHHCLQGDAFEILEKLAAEDQQYDIVVIDPPAFAKQKDELPGAKNAYRKLVRSGARLLSKDGILVIASCSSRLSSSGFFDLVANTLKSEGVKFELLKQTTHDVDHPVGFPEGAYLKCGYYKIK